VSILPGAEPWSADGGPLGVLVLHGFTGTPQAVRPWAEHLAAAGLSVELPLLPGHGTRWQDMAATGFDDWYAEAARSLAALRARCDAVAVCGLSMGGTLALRLAERQPDALCAAVVVNVSLTTERRDAALLPLLRRVVPALRGVAGDIKAPGATELAYRYMPLSAAYSQTRAWVDVRADLATIRCPVLAYRSREDHVVPASSTLLLVEGATGTTVEERVLDDSYHVATLDNDALAIFAGSLDFVSQHAGIDLSRAR